MAAEKLDDGASAHAVILSPHFGRRTPAVCSSIYPSELPGSFGLLCRNSTFKSFRFAIAGTVILSPGSLGTKDLHLSWLLKTHADPSLLLRMTVRVMCSPHRVSAHHGQPIGCQCPG